MKNLLTLFALGTTMMFASCGNNTEDKNIISLDQQKATTQKTAALSPCVIEVPCNDPALDAVSQKEYEHKYYNFCDSTVTIVGHSGGYGGPIFNKRPITELLGSEKTEMQNAYKKYQSLTQR